MCVVGFEFFLGLMVVDVCGDDVVCDDVWVMYEWVWDEVIWVYEVV